MRGNYRRDIRSNAATDSEVKRNKWENLNMDYIVDNVGTLFWEDFNGTEVMWKNVLVS